MNSINEKVSAVSSLLTISVSPDSWSIRSMLFNVSDHNLQALIHSWPDGAN